MWAISIVLMADRGGMNVPLNLYRWPIVLVWIIFNIVLMVDRAGVGTQ